MAVSGGPEQPRLRFGGLESETDPSLVAARVAAGLQSLSVLEKFHKDVCEAQVEYAKALREAALKSSQGLSEIKDNVGSLVSALIEESNSFVVSMARLSEQMASASQVKIVDPIQQAKAQYTRAAHAMGVTAAPACAFNSTGFGADSADPQMRQRKIRRAEAKLKLAEAELATAESSRQDLVTRFGEDLRPELYAKAKERVKRAGMLKSQAVAELGELGRLGKKESTGALEPPPADLRLIVNGESLRQMESVECKRVNVTRDSFRSMVRMYFRATQSVGAPLIALGRAVETYSPTFDMQVWLARQLNLSAGLVDKANDTLSALSQPETAWLQGASSTELGAADQAAVTSMKNLLRQKDTEVKHLQEEVVLLKDELTLARQHSSFLSGGLAKKDTGDDAASMSSRSTDRGDAPIVPALASSPVKHSAPGHDDDRRDDRREDRREDVYRDAPVRDESLTKTPADRTSLLKRMATVLKGRTEVDSAEDESSRRHETRAPDRRSSDHHTNDRRSSSQDYMDHDGEYLGSGSVGETETLDEEVFRLSDYVPLLTERLMVEFAPETKGCDKLMEIERRYEEYLWALRNLHIADLVRNEFWDAESYFRGFDAEYGVQCYTISVPYNLTGHREDAVETPHALEWGSPNVSPMHWQLFAYETLLLVYHTLTQAISAREVARLPAQDIHGIVLSDIQMTAPVDPKSRRMSHVDHDAEGGKTSRNDDRFIRTESGTVCLGEDPAQLQAVTMLEQNAALVRNLIRVWRVRLQLSANDNSVIASLLLPQGLEFGEESHSLGFSPLDVRFRVSRLHASWIAANVDAGGDAVQRAKLKSPVARAWIYRQLHFLRVCVLFKVSRLLKFCPQARNIYAWLNDWPFRADWHKLVASKIPPCGLEADRFLTGNMSQLVECMKLAMLMLADFFAALQTDHWGEDAYKETTTAVELPKYTSQYTPAPRPAPETSAETDRTHDRTHDTEGGSARKRDKPDDLVGYGYRNAEGFLRFVALLSCIAGLDKCIRQTVADDEKLIAAGQMGRGNSLDVSDLGDSEDDSEEGARDDNPQDAGRALYGNLWPVETNSFDIFSVLDANQLDVYWQYEAPVQHLVVAELCQLVCDPQSVNKLTVDAATSIGAVLVAAHMLQHGFDPSCWSRLKVPHVIMSLDTLAVYLIKAVWEQTILAAHRRRAEAPSDGLQSDLSFATSTPSSTDNKTSGALPTSTASAEVNLSVPPMSFMINSEVVKVLIAFASDLALWMASDASPRDEAGGLTSDPLGLSEASLSHQRLVRLLEATPHDLFESLGQPRGEWRTANGSKSLESMGVDTAHSVKNPKDRIAGGTRKYNHANDPDFALLDYDKLDELADKPSIFQQIEHIRDEPEGVSVLLPSRIERVMSELCLRRLLTKQMRLQMYHTLCDYRQHCEAETLPSMITLFERVADLLVLTPVKIAPQPPDVNHFNVLSNLPALLSGPIAQYDFYRHFICQSIRNLFDRLFRDAFATIHAPSDEDSWFLARLMDFDDEPEPEKLEIERSWAKVIGKFSEACSQFLEEIRAELIHYTPVWTHFLPGNQHALIVVHVAEERLRLMFDDLRSSPYWPEEDLPPNSAAIISTLSQFDRLVKDIRVASRFEHLLLDIEPLSAPLASSVATAMNKKLKAIDTLLDRCIKQESWRPISPPDILHSAATVDFFQFVHHVLDAVWQFNAAVEWILPILCQFLSRLTRLFADWVVQSTVDSRLIQLMHKNNQIFAHLTSPIPRVDVSLLGQLIGGGKDRRKKGLMGLIGLKNKKTKHRDIASQIQQVQRQAKDHTDVSPLYSGENTDNSEPEIGGPSEVEDNESPASDNEKASHRKKKRGKRRKNNPDAADDVDLPVEADISDELKELAARIGPILAVQLMNVGASMGKSPLPSWLTRLHNLSFFAEQLPELAQKILNIAIEQSAGQDPKHAEILKAVEKAGGRKAALNQRHEKDMDEGTVARVNAWTQQLHGAVEQCKMQLQLRSHEVCRMVALRVVFLDLCSDLFEELYNPTFPTGPCLDDVVSALNRTVLKFVQAAPQQFQVELLKCITHELIKAWVMVVTELGYMGHSFDEEDLRVLDNDLESIKSYSQQHNIEAVTELLGGAAEKEKGGLFAKIRGDDREAAASSPPAQRVDVFEHVADFLNFLRQQPLLLSQLGGNYSPEKLKAKQQGITSQIQDGADLLSSGGPEPAAEVPNVFTELGGGPAVAFDVKDILGAKAAKSKKKGMLGGMLRAVGLTPSSSNR